MAEDGAGGVDGGGGGCDWKFGCRCPGGGDGDWRGGVVGLIGYAVWGMAWIDN